MSLGAIVICFPVYCCKIGQVHEICTRNPLEACFRAISDDAVNLKLVLKSWVISHISLENGSFLISNMTHFWKYLISLKALVPGNAHVPHLGTSVGLLALFLAALHFSLVSRSTWHLGGQLRVITTTLITTFSSLFHNELLPWFFTSCWTWNKQAIDVHNSIL